MKASINDIATIQTGLFAKPTGAGELVYLQSRYFDEHGELQSTLHPDLSSLGIAERHILRAGDILLSAKGTKNFAAVYDSHNAPAVASTSFLVVRINKKNVIPAYIAWFLNQEQTQLLLKNAAIGTSIPSISKLVLENLEITIPSFEVQKTILQIAKLRNKEKSLKQKIEALRDLMIDQYLFQAINYER